MRARAELSRRLQVGEDPVEDMKTKGAIRQLRIIECIPFEIKSLLAEYAELRIRDEHIAKEKEKRNVEVR
jgi:hypothetical protein